MARPSRFRPVNAKTSARRANQPGDVRKVMRCCELVSGGSATRNSFFMARKLYHHRQNNLKRVVCWSRALASSLQLDAVLLGLLLVQFAELTGGVVLLLQAVPLAAPVLDEERKHLLGAGTVPLGALGALLAQGLGDDACGTQTKCFTPSLPRSSKLGPEAKR